MRKVCLVFVYLTEIFAAANLNVDKVLPLQCHVARCIVRNGISTHVLPPRIREFVALHDPIAAEEANID